MTGIKTKGRILLLLVGFTVIIFCLILRTGYIQIFESQELQKMAYEQQTRDMLISPKRGAILDTNGRKLAVSASVETVNVIPNQIKNPEEVARKLSEILGIDYQTVYTKVTKRTSMEIVQKKVEKDKTDKIRQWYNASKIKGIKIVEDTKRFYPNNNLAAYVLGFTGTENQGLDGIEKTYEQVLKGLPGRVISETDVRGNDIPFENEKYIDPQNGRDVVLTIDASIQHFAEKYLEDAITENQAIGGGVVIITRPKTGDILAMAVKPDYDINNPFGPYNEELKATWDTMAKGDKTKALQKIWRNKAISDTYEPGSTFKIITSVAGLEEGVVKPTDQFVDKGSITISGVTMKCWRYYRPHGLETFAQAVENSCNPVFIEVGQRLGKERFYKYVEAFGFKDKTGIELPGETTGIFHDISAIGPVELGTISFGQRFQITPIQLASALSALANDGKLMKMRLVKEVRDASGNVIERNEPQVIRQAISKETAQEMKTIMEGVVSRGTGKNSYLKGFRVAGKTGTAEQGVNTNVYVASFVGMAPVNDPQVAILVALFDPKGASHQGGAIAAPVAGKILNDTLRYLEVVPQYTEEEMATREILVPDIRGKSVKEAQKILQDRGFKYELPMNDKNEDVPVLDQTPKPGVNLIEKSVILLYTQQKDARPVVTVPDITKKTITDATAILKNLGLNIKISGDGMSVSQNPPPNSKVEAGSIVTVDFKVSDVD